jgi:hypothetical protein
MGGWSLRSSFGLLNQSSGNRLLEGSTGNVRMGLDTLLSLTCRDGFIGLGEASDCERGGDGRELWVSRSVGLGLPVSGCG